jgi:hypothetical protein
MFILMGDKACRGVYDTERTLRLAVDHWMKERPDDTLTYEEWQTNYSPEPLSWSWCYIAPGSKTINLMAGGSCFIPSKRFRGVNLIGIRWARVSDKTLDKLHQKRQLLGLNRWEKA